MLIAELESAPALRVKVTQRCLNDIRSKTPAEKKLLAELVEFKSQNGNKSWGKKDAPFTGNPKLRTWWHFHLTFGWDVLVYRIREGIIWMVCIIDHEDMVKSGSARLIKYIDNLGNADWFDFDFSETDDLPVMSSAEFKDVEDAVYELAGQHPDMLKQFLAGQTEPVMELLRMCIEQSVTDQVKDQMIDRAFKGKFQVFVQNVMKQMHVMEGRRGAL